MCGRRGLGRTGGPNGCDGPPPPGGTARHRRRNSMGGPVELVLIGLRRGGRGSRRRPDRTRLRYTSVRASAPCHWTLTTETVASGRIPRTVAPEVRSSNLMPIRSRPRLLAFFACFTYGQLPIPQVCWKRCYIQPLKPLRSQITDNEQPCNRHRLDAGRGRSGVRSRISSSVRLALREPPILP